MTTPRRADARRGFFVRFVRSPRTRCKVGKVGHVAACLTACYSIIVPDGGTRSRTSSPPDGGDYTFLRLCGLHCAAAYLYLAARRAHRHAPQLTQGQSWRTLERRHRAQRTQREDTGREQGRGREGRRLHRAPMCAGAGGVLDIGRDGTSSGRRTRSGSQLHTCGRAQAGGRTHIGRICGDYAADYDAGRADGADIVDIASFSDGLRAGSHPAQGGALAHARTDGQAQARREGQDFESRFAEGRQGVRN